MKKHCLRLVERLRDNWPSMLVRTAGRHHDPFLVDSMISFNFRGGWRELPSEGSDPKYMTAKSNIVLINERFTA
jgi:hypothetical protein